jgi:hypothetical protein
MLKITENRKLLVCAAFLTARLVDESYYGHITKMSSNKNKPKVISFMIISNFRNSSNQLETVINKLFLTKYGSTIQIRSKFVPIQILPAISFLIRNLVVLLASQ